MKTCYLLLTSALIFLQCSGIRIKSAREKGSIQVDGRAYDWENYPVEYNEDWHLVYGAVNNDSTLFLQFSFNDPHLARMMARRGLILWFGETKKFGLKYSESFPADNFKKFQPDEMYIPKGNFSVVAEDTIVAEDLSQYKPVAAKFGLDKGLYCMEFSIPLNIMDFPGGIFSEKYQFVFQLAALSQAERDNIRQAREERKSRAGRGPAGMTGGMEGGRTGRRPGSEPAQRNLDIDGKEIDFEVMLNDQEK